MTDEEYAIAWANGHEGGLVDAWSMLEERAARDNRLAVRDALRDVVDELRDRIDSAATAYERGA